MRKRRWLIWLGSALILGGAAVLAHFSWRLSLRTAAQARAKEWLSITRVGHTRLPTPALPMRRGDVVGQVEIPRLHLSVMIFEGDDAGILEQGAGHIPGTALPSSSGNIGIAAHRDTFFRPLRLVRENDVITLKTSAGTSRYAVTETEIVKPTAISVLAQAPGRDLTLVTCYPFFYLGKAPERFIVHARKIV
jgi:LPXTG-site transpeptidase (sortase) family protein